MFAKISTLALLLAPLVSALTVDPLTDATSGGEVTISWTLTSQDDPGVFSIELANPEQLRNAIAIANNVDANLGSLTLTLPLIETPGGGFSIQLVQIDDINNVYAESADFVVSAQISTSQASSSTSASLSASSASSATGTSTVPLSTATTSATSSGFGRTISNTDTATSETGTGTDAASAEETSSTDSAASLRIGVPAIVLGALGLVMAF